MASLKDVLNQTRCTITGLIRGVNEYYHEKSKKTYYSIDVDIQGTKMPLNVRIEYDQVQRFPEYEIVKFDVFFRPAFGGKGVEVVAV